MYFSIILVFNHVPNIKKPNLVYVICAHGTNGFIIIPLVCLPVLHLLYQIMITGTV